MFASRLVPDEMHQLKRRFVAMLVTVQLLLVMQDAGEQSWSTDARAA